MKEDNMLDQEILNNYATCILDQKYKQIDINKVAADQTHFTLAKHHDLQNALTKDEKLIDGSFGVYLHQEIYVDSIPRLEPVQHQMYLFFPCLWTNIQQVDIGGMWFLQMDIALLHCCQKDSWTGQISYLNSVNKCLKCKNYLLPIIHDVLQWVLMWKFSKNLIS